MKTPVTQPVAFLGPEGTFSEEALLASMPAGCHPFPYQSIPDVMAAVSSGAARYGLVPIENSLEGAVAITLDLLAFGHDDLLIVRETTHAIHQQLIARAPLELARVTKVISHPHVHGQCHTFLRQHLPQAEHEAANSTVEAVRQVKRVDRPWAAIGPKLAADMYECVVVAENIEDSVDNRTRFVLLAREPAAQDLAARYKTSIVCAIAHDQPGSLLMILSEFADRGINLTKIESRPSKQGLGDYIFFIDLEGRRDDPAISQALQSLDSRLSWMKVLGSYPIT